MSRKYLEIIVGAKHSYARHTIEEIISQECFAPTLKNSNKEKIEKRKDGKN